MLSRLADLGGGLILNPEHVVSVKRESYGRFLIVKDVLGDIHEVQVRYGETIYQAEKRVLKLLNTEEYENA